MIDEERMTWKRQNINPGHENIVGLEPINSGKLWTKPHIDIGKVGRFQYGSLPDEYINTTRVERIEALDYPGE